MEEDIRDKLKKQREKWLRERELYKDREELEKEMKQAQPNQNIQTAVSGKSSYQELEDRLLIRMSEKLVEKQMKSKPGSNYKQDSDYEETLHNQVMSNTCPICFELFLPPDHQPFILFPCGHTFCKVCINSYAKQKNKCPFCRSAIKSMAPNISLQNLILSASEKKDEVIKNLQQKQEQMIKNNAFQMDKMSGQHSINTEKYLSDYKLLEVRCGVLEEERSESIIQFQQIKEKVKSKEKSLQTLSQEKQDCLDRLKKVQKELELIKEFEEKEEQQLEQLKLQKNKQESSIKFINDSLTPLMEQKDKVKLMIQTLAPHLMYEL